ncbi:MAG: phosphatase PAP2 family protein [Minisyncoccia bacterium]
MVSFHRWAKTFLFLLVYIISGFALVLIIDGLISGTELTPFNTAIETAVLAVRVPWLTNFMVWITNIGSPMTLTVATIILVITLLLKGETYDALLYIVSMSVAVVSLIVMKDTFQMARPDAVIIGISGWSFPSGHAAVATTFFFTTAYSFYDWVESMWGKTILVVGCIIGAALVSFSRIYLGAHWSLDILAGFALGLMAVSFSALVFNIFLEETRPKRRKV